MKTRQEWLETLVASAKEMVEKVDAKHPPTLPYAEVARLARDGAQLFIERAPHGLWDTADCLMLAAQLIHMAREVHYGSERGGKPDEPTN